jgi:hypothetical protein
MFYTLWDTSTAPVAVKLGYFDTIEEARQKVIDTKMANWSIIDTKTNVTIEYAVSNLK